MKIISKFKDFYDNATCSTYCDDSEVIYVRKSLVYKVGQQTRRQFCITEILQQQQQQQQDYSLRSFLKFVPVDLSLVVVGFCGKLYTAIAIPKLNDQVKYSASKFKKHGYIYTDRTLTEEELLETKEAYKYGIGNTKRLIKTRKKFYSGTNRWRHRNFSSSLRNLFEHVIDKNKSKYENYFLKYRTPIWVLSNLGQASTTLVINPCLEDLQFYKIFLPQQVYQELEMFFGSLLVHEQDPAQITNNKVLRDSKGFDKHSFKNSPSGKKKHYHKTK